MFLSIHLLQSVLHANYLPKFFFVFFSLSRLFSWKYFSVESFQIVVKYQICEDTPKHLSVSQFDSGLSYLVADTRLYTLPCRSVRRSIRRSVGPSVRHIFESRFSHYCSRPTVRNWIAVYQALFSISASFLMPKWRSTLVHQCQKMVTIYESWWIIQPFWISTKYNSRKSIRWSAVPALCLFRFWFMLRAGAGQRPKRSWWPMDLLICGVFSSSS